MSEEIRVLYIANTKYQILNVLSIIEDDAEEKKDWTEYLLIRDTFGDGDTIAERIKEKRIFKKVFLCKRVKRARTEMGFFVKCLSAEGILSEYLFDDDNIKTLHFSKIYTGDTDPIAVAFSYLSGFPEIALYEDGLGTYLFRTPAMPRRGKIERNICERFKLAEYTLSINSIYVRKPKLCDNLLIQKIVKIPEISGNERFRATIKDIFLYEDNAALKNNKVIYLSQPLSTDVRTYNGFPITEKIVELLDEICEYTIRFHPRESVLEINSKRCTIDLSKSMWELDCIYELTDNHILMAAGSTAQFSPKILADKEPFLVFLHRIVFRKEYADRLEKKINEFSRLYKDKKRIFMPSTVQEVAKIIKELL